MCIGTMFFILVPNGVLDCVQVKNISSMYVFWNQKKSY